MSDNYFEYDGKNYSQTNRTDRLPCTDCHSSDAVSIYQNKGESGELYHLAKCFSCGEVTHQNKFKQKGYGEYVDMGVTFAESIPASVSEQFNQKFGTATKPAPVVRYPEVFPPDVPFRGIEPDVFTKFSAGVQYNDPSDPTLVTLVAYPYFDSSDLCAMKTRDYSRKEKREQFLIIGQINKAQLYGANLFKPGGKTITICEGEKDAMSAFQMLGKRTPCVSIKSGTSALTTEMQKSFEYVNSFEEIRICMDPDEPGRQAVKKFCEANLFNPSKIKIVRLNPNIGDANDYLDKGNVKEFVEAVYGAHQYTPDDVFIGKALVDACLNEPEVKCFEYPFETLNATTFGMRKGELDVWVADTGVGKCLAKDTPVIMFDGSVCKVQDVELGDLLMGPDSTPRTVLSTVSGRDQMYRVDQGNGDAYEVNSEHILSLYNTRTKEKFNMNVFDYLLKSSSSTRFKHEVKGYKSGLINFPSQKDLVIDPYMLGLWLGDGNSDRFSITSVDQEIIETIMDYCTKIGSTFSITGGDLFNLGENNKEGQKKSNRATDMLREIGVFNNKHIPHCYLTSSEESRLRLLAGMIDTDGYLSPNKVFVFTNKNERLIDDTAFLARSLGFRVTKKATTKTIKSIGFVGSYFDLSISGGVERIPTKLPRKQVNETSPNKNWLVHSIQVTPAPEAGYFGFQINGDQQFLLGDFTVTHNSTVFKHLVQSLLLNNKDEKIGMFMFEELPKRTLRDLVGLQMGRRLHLPHEPINAEDFKETAGQLNLDNLVIWGNFGSTDVDVIMKKLEYVVSQGCEFIFLDHISMITADQRNVDERAALDQVVNYLNNFVTAKNVHISIIAHTNREGQIRGTAGIEKVAHKVVRIDREKKHPDPILRNVIRLSVEKNRFNGDLGPAGFLEFSSDTGRLTERLDLDDETFYEFKSKGAGNGYGRG